MKFLDTPNLAHVYGSDERWESALGYDDPQMISLPHSHFSYITHGRFYEDLTTDSPINRLQYIKQLGIVSAYRQFISNHDRYNHSLITGSLVEIALVNNGIRDTNLINLGIAAGLHHDVAMPPYSDYGKLGDEEAMDEELNIPLVLGGIEEVLRKYGIDKDRLVDAVRGKQNTFPIGALVNSSGIDMDKISYIGCDLHNLGLPSIHPKIKPYLIEDPFMLDVYLDARIDKDKIHFEDPERVRRFLMVRALMFTEIYFDPTNRARQAFMKREMVRLWKSGILNRDKLLRMRDFEFDRLVGEHSPILRQLYSISWNWEEVDRIPDGKQIQETENLVVEKWKDFNPAISTRIKDGRRVVKFSTAFPKEAKELEEMSRDCGYTGVYRRFED